ncbi:MAG: ORF6N domain-containing protein, partial [Chthoniobacterales bacterium]
MHAAQFAIPMKIPIRHIRDVAVILDADLAAIYSVSTKRLNEQVKRDKDRFPADFVFRLTSEEARSLDAARSQIATLKKGQDIKHLPYAFTEHGALMAANVLRSESPKSRSGVSPL